MVPVPNPPLQLFPEPALEVRVWLLPLQIVTGPTGVMVGVGGTGLTETTTVFETKEVHPAAIAWQV